MKNIIVSVLIVNYNGYYLLKDCIDSLKEQTFKQFEIVLIDNASKDDSVDFIKNNYPDVNIIQNQKNLGFSGGNNVGIEQARGKYIVVLNNDTKVAPYFLERLVNIADACDDVGMLAPKILNYYKPELIDSTGLVLYPDGIARGRGRLEKDIGQYDRQEEVFFPSGCAALYKRNMLEDIGLFDDDFFMYLEDVDLGLRARLAGWRCLYVPEAIVYHKYSATTKAYSAQKAFFVERNRIWVLIKNFPLSLIILSPFYTLKRYFFTFYGLISGRGVARRFIRSENPGAGFKIIFEAYLSALKHSGKMIGKRREIMRLKRINNKDFWRWLKKFSTDVKDVTLKE